MVFSKDRIQLTVHTCEIPRSTKVDQQSAPRPRLLSDERHDRDLGLGLTTYRLQNAQGTSRYSCRIAKFPRVEFLRQWWREIIESEEQDEPRLLELSGNL
ncbi:unnamed protein product [Nesidiocoris tenuis]|uniref:Uncharacterized protein n=1 Tax=Nesidiocoris tenuis TaxID=355587 RepID=A0A6H5FUD3_9HEMI|nr:unnamed protein product [Nesidiocoris tenuis]